MASAGRLSGVADDAELDRRFAEALEAQRVENAANPVADTPMWLAHHWPARYDRCAKVGRWHVCRRCLVLYPVAIGVAVLAGFGVRWPDSWDVWLFWLLPIPGVVEFSLDALGVIIHRPRRQMVVSALLAVAYGKILWRYSHHPGDGLVWAVVLTNITICGVAAICGAVLRGGPDGSSGGSTVASNG